MDDTISRQAAIDLAKDIVFKYQDGTEYRHRCIDPYDVEQLPTIDAVDIVRCKNCIWRLGTDCTRFAEVRILPEDFCSRGEAKTKRSRNEKEQS